MKIPSNQPDKETLLRLVIDACMASKEERKSLYEKRRRYFLYGCNQDVKVRHNRLKSHIKLVASFLFSTDSLTFNISPPKNADENTIKQVLALQDDFNQDVHDSDIGDQFGEALMWALNFDTMILKMGWNDTTGSMFAKMVEPVCFGIYREDDPDFSSQPAMNHTFLLDYDDACTRLKRAGRSDMIPKLQIDGESGDTGLPPAVQQMIISATGGENLQGNIMGSVNPDYESNPSFVPKVLAPMVRFHETWIWDTDSDDYRIFHSLDGPVLLSDSKDTINAIKSAQGEKKAKLDSETNWFLKQENPFVVITPYQLYNYFWGDCHQEDIIPLQQWSNERLTQINEVLNRQEDPAKVFSGFQGLADEKADALGGPGSWVSDAMPGAKVEELAPKMPEDLFREYNEIGGMMMEASGLTEVVSGKGSGGARGGQQQKQMQITGGGQIKKVATGLEKPLVRMAHVGLKLKMKNDDSKIKLKEGEDFVAAQVDDNLTVRVSGHSHSPLFTQETKELAAMLFKAQAIDQEWLLRLMNPPALENLLHSLAQRKAAAAAEKAAHPPEADHGKKKH